MDYRPRNIADEPTVAQPPRSAWAQPASTSLASGRRPAGSATSTWPLLIAGGAVVLVAALIITIVLITSGGGRPGGGKTRSLAGAPTSAPTPTRTVFTKVPSDSCALLSASVISTYVPLAACQQPLSGGQGKSGSISRESDWDSAPSAQGLAAQLDITLSIGQDSTTTYDENKLAALKAMGGYDTITDQHAVTGVGDKAYLAYGTSRPGPDNGGANNGDTVILVLVGNAAIQVTYNAGTTAAGGAETPLPKEQAEAAATAIAKDYIGHLS